MTVLVHFNIFRFNFEYFLLYSDMSIFFIQLQSAEPYFYLIFICCFLFYICFTIGLVFNLRNYLVSVLFIELIYLSIIVINIAHYHIFGYDEGKLYSLILIILAASESAVGLSIIVSIFVNENKISFNGLSNLE